MKIQFVDTTSTPDYFYAINMLNCTGVWMASGSASLDFATEGSPLVINRATNAEALTLFGEVKDFLDNQQQLETITP